MDLNCSFTLAKVILQHSESVSSQRGTEEGQEAIVMGSSMRGKKLQLSTRVSCTFRQSPSLETVTIQLDKTLSNLT